MSIPPDEKSRKDAPDEKLRKERAFFRQVIDLNPNFVFAKDREGRFTLVNQAIADAYGTTVEELIGKTDADFNPHLEEVRHFRSIDLRVMDTREELLIPEEKITDASGRLRWLQTVKRPIVDETGKANQVLGIATDITQRKRVEEDLRASEERFRLLAQNLPGTIYLCKNDEHYSVIYLNDEIEKLSGYPKEEFLAQRVTLASLLHPEDHPSIVRAVNEAIERREPFHLTYRLRHRDGAWRWAEEVGCGIFRGNELLMLEGYIMDITQRKADEDSLRQLEDQLRHSQKMEAIGSLAGGIAHDFNNLLTGILGFADLLKGNTVQPREVPQIAELIERAAQRAEQLTSQLLGFARRGKNQDVPVCVHDAIDEVIDFLSRTLSKQIVIAKQLRAGRSYVRGDPMQIEQALLNLALNARDAMETAQSGTLCFETAEVALNEESARVPGCKPGNYLSVRVTDTGCGIDHALQERIFEPFFTTKSPGKGTGMGLAMVYGIVQNHNGTISVKSEPGKGTAFEILFPLMHTASAGSFKLTSERQPLYGEGHILLIDDEAIVREVGEAMLTRLGYKVTTAPGGKEALEIYRDDWRSIDLVIVDMMMPGMGGKECFVELKKINRGVRALLTTGFGLNHAAQEALDEGMIGFVQKPYRLTDLADKVHASLARDGSAGFTEGQT